MSDDEKKSRYPAKAGAGLYDPFSELEAMRQRMDSLFDDMFIMPSLGRRGGLNSSMPTIREPLAYLEEHKDKYVAVLECPGLEKEDFDIEVSDDTIKVKAQRKEESKKEEKDFAYHERSYSSFYRSFALPKQVDSSKVKASYKNGILSIELPKAQIEEEKTKKIKVE